MVDLVKMKALIWSGEELGAKFDEVDIPADTFVFCYFSCYNRAWLTWSR
jgi:hypothetical protein